MQIKKLVTKSISESQSNVKVFLYQGESDVIKNRRESQNFIRSIILCTVVIAVVVVELVESVQVAGKLPIQIKSADRPRDRS